MRKIITIFVIGLVLMSSIASATVFLQVDLINEELQADDDIPNNSDLIYKNGTANMSEEYGHFANTSVSYERSGWYNITVPLSKSRYNENETATNSYDGGIYIMNTGIDSSTDSKPSVDFGVSYRIAEAYDVDGNVKHNYVDVSLEVHDRTDTGDLDRYQIIRFEDIPADAEYIKTNIKKTENNWTAEMTYKVGSSTYTDKKESGALTTLTGTQNSLFIDTESDFEISGLVISDFESDETTTQTMTTTTTSNTTTTTTTDGNGGTGFFGKTYVNTIWFWLIVLFVVIVMRLNRGW